MRKKKFNNDFMKELREETEYYTVEKILDMKEQNGKTYYLIKWQDWDVKTCTWEEQDHVQHLKSLIKDFQNSRRHDHHKNHGLKQLDYVESGMSPYQATKFYGHLLYGDQPKAIKSIQMIQKDHNKEIHFQVEWHPREDGFKPSNSLLESSLLEEYASSFLIKFFESKIELIPNE